MKRAYTAGADDAYAAAVSMGPRYAWHYAAGYVGHLVTSRARRLMSRGRGVMLAAAIAGAFIGLWISPGRAYSAPMTAPYGGCSEAWQAPQSSGADWCRSRGWVVRPRIVVSPRGVVRFHRLPSCAVEDASSGPVPCSWNIRATDGNGAGMAYFVTGSNDRPRFHYVKRVR